MGKGQCGLRWKVTSSIWTEPSWSSDPIYVCTRFALFSAIIIPSLIPPSSQCSQEPHSLTQWLSLCGLVGGACGAQWQPQLHRLPHWHQLGNWHGSSLQDSRGGVGAGGGVYG